MKKTQRLLATAMTPFLIIQCLLTPLSVWADSLQVQPESTDYSVSAADSSEDEDIVLNDEQQGGCLYGFVNHSGFRFSAWAIRAPGAPPPLGCPTAA